MGSLEDALQEQLSCRSCCILKLHWNCLCNRSFNRDFSETTTV